MAKKKGTAEKKFDRDGMARWYAQRHLKTDPGIRTVYYLPTNAPDREIRFIEVNDFITDRGGEQIEPIDFGVDTGSDSAHSLMVLDVTPSQWEGIGNKKIKLPPGWSLENAISLKQ